MTSEQRREPRDAEEAAAFKGMGEAIAVIRERRGLDREDLAARCEMTPAELEQIERGELDESWGGVRLIAKGLEVPLGALMIEAEEFAPGPGGERWRQNTREAEAEGSISEENERRLWEELNSLLGDAVPEGASEKQAEDAILLAVMGHDPEIHDLYERIRRLARDEAGYLRDRMEEPGPIARVRRRLYGRWA